MALQIMTNGLSVQTRPFPHPISRGFTVLREESCTLLLTYQNSHVNELCESSSFDSSGVGVLGSYAVTIGRISRFKGTYEAVRHLAGSDLNLVVIGGGSEDEIESDCEPMGKENGVVVMSYQDYPQKRCVR